MFLLKLKFIIPLAILAAVLATFGAYSYINNQKILLEQKRLATRQVVVTRADVPAGSRLTEILLQTREFPSDLTPEGSFSSLADLTDRVTKADLYAGEVVVESRLAPKGSGGGVAAVIPAGMRAMTVAVNVVSGVSGFILPHARVDVLATVSSNSDKEESTTTTILENIEVLAVDQTVNSKDDDPITVKSVTLLVDPAQAEKLALASSEGKLQLVLRNLTDQEAVASSGVRLKEIISKSAPAPAPVRRAAVTAPSTPAKAEPPQEPPKQVIEVYRSSTRSEVVLDENKATEGKPQK